MKGQIQTPIKDEESLWNQEEIKIQKYAQKPTNLEIYEFQVSGKTPKYINNIQGTIYKLYSQQQHLFYQFLNSIPNESQASMLKEFIPQYFGITKKQIAAIESESKARQDEGNSRRNIWIDHISSRSKKYEQTQKTFLILKNITCGYSIPHIMDLKLGKKKNKKNNTKFQTSTTNSHKFRINGMMVSLKEGDIYEQYFISKYFGQKITVDHIQSYLALFFFNGDSLNLKLLNEVRERLDKLIVAFQKFRGIKFISSSLFLAYDGENPQNFSVNLIDFDKYEHIEDDDGYILEGLVNIQTFLGLIIKNEEDNSNKCKERELQIFKKDMEVVPQHKLKQYS